MKMKMKNEIIGQETGTYDPTTMIAILWSIHDFDGLIDEPYTEAQAKEALRRVKKYHDCADGVNWDVLRARLEMVLHEAKRDAQEYVKDIHKSDEPVVSEDENEGDWE